MSVRRSHENSQTMYGQPKCFKHPERVASYELQSKSRP